MLIAGSRARGQLAWGVLDAKWYVPAFDASTGGGARGEDGERERGGGQRVQATNVSEGQAGIFVREKHSTAIQSRKVNCNSTVLISEKEGKKFQ